MSTYSYRMSNIIESPNILCSLLSYRSSTVLPTVFPTLIRFNTCLIDLVFTWLLYLCLSLSNFDRLNEVRRNCMSKIYGDPLNVHSKKGLSTRTMRTRFPKSDSVKLALAIL